MKAYRVHVVGAELARLDKVERNKALAEIIIAAMKLVGPTAQIEYAVVNAMEQIERNLSAASIKKKVAAKRAANLKDVASKLGASLSRAH